MSRSCRVALADDAPDVRALLRAVLEEKGFDVVGEARNGVEAVELVEAEQPDVILLDLSMPVMDGLEAMPKIQEVSPRTRVVVLSGFVNTEVRAKVLDMGAAACLEKGIRLDELIGSVGEVCPSAGSAERETERSSPRSAGARPPSAESPTGPSAGSVPFTPVADAAADDAPAHIEPSESTEPSEPTEPSGPAEPGPSTARAFLDGHDLLPALLHELTPTVAVLERSLDEVDQAARSGELARAQSSVRTARRSAQALSSLAASFVLLQRDDGSLPLVTEAFDLGDHLRDVVEELAPIADEHGVQVSVDSPVRVIADRGRIRQVIANLLVNAVRFSPTGSIIDVSVAVEGDRAVVTVTDQGPGIPADLGEEVFEKYSRGDDEPSGLGLGLYIARRIARAHGGDVNVDGGAPVGARVILSLPIALV